jgi:hypothetical protein
MTWSEPNLVVKTLQVTVVRIVKRVWLQSRHFVFVENPADGQADYWHKVSIKELGKTSAGET